MGNKRVSRFLRHHRGLLQDTRKRTVHVTNSYAGVEYLLRDVKDTTISTLATEVSAKLTALKGLDARLKEIRSYLDLVIDGKLPLNHAILYHLQYLYVGFSLYGVASNRVGMGLQRYYSVSREAFV